MDSYSPIPAKTETVTLNGSTVYYEVYGKGEPLFLLHGFTWSSKAWIPYVPGFASDFEVYLVDLKGHGKSAPFTDKISLKSVANEIDALADYLKLEKINAIGYSYGAETLFQLVLLNPGLIKSMIVIGSCGTWRAGDFPNLVEHLTYENINEFPWMRDQHIDEKQIRSILHEIRNYNVSVSDWEMESIQAKTLFVVGDRDDAVSLESIFRAREHLPNSYLWVVPNTGHSAHTGDNKNDFIRFSKKFLSPGWPKIG